MQLEGKLHRNHVHVYYRYLNIISKNDIHTYIQWFAKLSIPIERLFATNVNIYFWGILCERPTQRVTELWTTKKELHMISNFKEQCAKVFSPYFSECSQSPSEVACWTLNDQTLTEWLPNKYSPCRPHQVTEVQDNLAGHHLQKAVDPRENISTSITRWPNNSESIWLTKFNQCQYPPEENCLTST